MKIRRGFVTNSSSSSFIIGLDRIPTCDLDLGMMLNIRNFEYYAREMCILYNDIVDDLCKEDSKKQIDTMDVIRKIMYGYHVEEDEVDEEDINTANKLVEKANKHKYSIILEYGDDDSTYASLEHGGLFDSIVVHKESHH